MELEKDLKINQTVKTVETVKTEKRTITCMSHINSGIRLNSSLNIESEVKNLQKFLNDYYDGELDVNGQYGQDDKNTVIKFQELNNLDADGAVGPQTRRIINAIYCVKNENTN